MDFLGIPGLLEPQQMRELLQHRQSERARTRRAAAAPDTVAALRDGSSLASSGTENIVRHEQLAMLRRELNGLVAAWHHRTGQAHGITHAALRKECGGPAAAVANAEQLQARIDRLRDWAAKKSS
jgi:hypothetical protein